MERPKYRVDCVQYVQSCTVLLASRKNRTILSFEVPMSQGDMLNAVKASRQPVGANVANKFGGLAGETMTGPRFPGDDEYDNDASFDPTLNSSSLEYFMNPSDDEAYGENRWKTGGRSRARRSCKCGALPRLVKCPNGGA